MLTERFVYGIEVFFVDSIKTTSESEVKPN